VPACVVCAFSRVPSRSSGTGAGRRLGAYFGMFAAAVCVQAMCWVFDRAEKVPPAVAEAGATSGTCLRALSALSRVCRRFKRVWHTQAVLAHILACLLLLCVCR